MQLEFPFSRSAENREDELFHFISIFLSSAGKVRGRRRTHRYTVVALTQRRRAVRAPRRLLLRWERGRQVAHGLVIMGIR